MVEVKNTISFAYPNGCAKPTMGELANFVRTLDANPSEMDTLYRIAEEHSIFIKFKTEESMQYALTHNSEQLTFHYTNGTAVEIRMSLAGGNVQYVRVYDLPPEVPDNDISSVLGKYGKVKRVVRDKFPVELGLNMFTGVRGAYMDVKKEIPSSLMFLNRKGNIFYSGNMDKCFRCKKEGHRMNSCPTRKSREQQQQQQSSNSYAAVAAGGTSSDTSQEQEEKGDYEEVIHEEVVKSNECDIEVTIPETGTKDANKPKPPPVFKYPNDAYYFYKFGIVDYTETKRAKDEEEAKRKEERQQEEIERQRMKAAEKIRSPPRKNKKNC